MSQVLVVATSRKTRGGITSVIKVHEMGEQWKQYHCRWISTHRDRWGIIKLLYLVCGLSQYLIILPFYDLVHIHLSEPVSAFRKFPFMLWAKLWRKKTIVHFHSFSPYTTVYGRFRWIYRYLFIHSDAVITLSEYWRNVVAEEYRLGDKVKIIYNPCPVQEDKGKISFCPDDYEVRWPKTYSILYAGTVNARKGYEDMIRAFARIAKKYPDWMIVFAGNGEVEQGMALATDLGISSQTLFLGWVTGEAKERSFREATVFCLPSYAEGFPMAVLDAWTYGLPVITTPVGGIPDIAQDGKNMLLFTPGDVAGLACQMERMISDRELRENIAKESRHLAQTTFNVGTINRQIGKLYEELLVEEHPL